MKENCRGLCEYLPHLKSPRYFSRNERYNYCNACGKAFPDRPGLYIYDKLLRKVCPCCGRLLRTKRRNPPRVRARLLHLD